MCYNEDMLKTAQKLISLLDLKKTLALNIALLFILKIALPIAGPQLANVLDQILPFNSREIVTETNKARTVNNLLPLESNAQLDLAASEKLGDMITDSYFAHTSPKGATPWYWIEKNGYNYSHAGENLALGFLRADQTVSAWMDSPSHRANIMNSNYKEIGVATGKAQINGISGTIVVQMFGKLITSATLPSSTTKLVSAVPSPAPSAAIANNNIAGSEVSVPVEKTNSLKPQRGPVKLQYVSTDISIPAVSAPSKPTNNMVLSFKLNGLYQSYLALTVILLTGIIILRRSSRKIILAAAVNLLLLFVSIIIPPAATAARSLIF